MILDTALAVAPALVLALGLAALAVLASRPRSDERLPVAARRVAVGAFVLGLVAAARLSLVQRAQPVDLPFLTRIASDPAVPTLPVPFATVHLDAIALMGLSAVLILGLLAILAVDPESAASRRPLVGILFAAVLGTFVSICPDVASFATLWVALCLSLAALTLGPTAEATTPAPVTTPISLQTPVTDARRWLTLVVVGSPLFWVVGSALVVATGSLSLVADRRAPVGVVVGLILVGAVVAGIAPFATRRLPHQRRPEVAYLIDGMLPLSGVLLAVRAVGIQGATNPMLPGAVLALLGLSGIASTIISQRRGRGIGDAGRIEGSIAFLVLVAPVSLAAPASLLIVGAGAIARALDRLPQRERILPVYWPLALSVPGWAASWATEQPPSRVVRHRPPTIDRRIPDLARWLAELLADFARQAEQRYDLAIGLLVALATVFIFYE